MACSHPPHLRCVASDGWVLCFFRDSCLVMALLRWHSHAIQFTV